MRGYIVCVSTLPFLYENIATCITVFATLNTMVDAAARIIPRDEVMPLAEVLAGRLMRDSVNRHAVAARKAVAELRQKAAEEAAAARRAAAAAAASAAAAAAAAEGAATPTASALTTSSDDASSAPSSAATPSAAASDASASSSASAVPIAAAEVATLVATPAGDTASTPATAPAGADAAKPSAASSSDRKGTVDEDGKVAAALTEIDAEDAARSSDLPDSAAPVVTPNVGYGFSLEAFGR